jgi:hypothetical protein
MRERYFFKSNRVYLRADQLAIRSFFAMPHNMIKMSSVCEALLLKAGLPLDAEVLPERIKVLLTRE